MSHRLLSVVILCLAVPATAQAADLHADTSNFSATFASAAGGDRILLAAGNYGTFNGGSKSSPVTITPDTGVSKSSVTMTLNLGGASSNITVDGITTPGLSMDTAGTTSNIIVENSTFTGLSVIKSCSSSNTSILLDNNTFNNIDASPTTYEGRISLPVDGGGTCGVTISNSTFDGGCSDGIQTGANGVRILNNVFTNIVQSCSPGGVIHVDAVEFYGSQHTLLDGNLFLNDDDCLMAPDGTDHETVTNNVCDAFGNYGFTLGHDDHSVVKHNTLVSNAIRVYDGNPGIDSVGTVVRDNVTIGGSSIAGTSLDVDYNLNVSGAHNATGTPSYVGGSSPTTWAGYQLTSSSPGHAAADDGLDMGIVVPDTTAPGTTITTPPSNGTSTSASIPFTGSDNVGVDHFECKLDAGSYATCTSPASYTGLSVGSHTFSVRAYDAAGNVDPTPATATWTISAPATKPTYVDEHETAWTTATNPKSTTFSVTAGQVLVAYAMSEDGQYPLTIGGSGLTWTLKQSYVVTGYGALYMWSATAASTGSVTVTFTRTTGAGHFGGDVLRFSGSSGIGASAVNHSTGAPDAVITTTATKSAIVQAAVDWNAGDGTTRAIRNTRAGSPISDDVNETTYARSASRYTVYGGFLNNVSPNNYDVGWSLPTGQKYTIAAVEVKGT